jgi:hypothetical protein
MGKASNPPRKVRRDFASLPSGNEKSPELSSGLFVISGGERGIYKQHQYGLSRTI